MEQSWGRGPGKSCLWVPGTHRCQIARGPVFTSHHSYEIPEIITEKRFISTHDFGSFGLRSLDPLLWRQHITAGAQEAGQSGSDQGPTTSGPLSGNQEFNTGPLRRHFSKLQQTLSDKFYAGDDKGALEDSRASQYKMCHRHRTWVTRKASGCTPPPVL